MRASGFGATMVAGLLVACSASTGEGLSSCHGDGDCPSGFSHCRIDLHCWSTPDPMSDSGPPHDAASVVDMGAPADTGTDASCGAALADCDHMASNGCEVHTDHDLRNCGSCGHTCPTDTTCVMGGCVYASTGADGDFHPTADMVLPAGTYNYVSITIPSGVTVTTNGTGVLDLRATGAVTINGTINLSGGNGALPSMGTGGGDTGRPTTAPAPASGSGCAVANGGAGGAGSPGMGTCATCGGSFGGGASGCSGPSGGGGYAGGAGGRCGCLAMAQAGGSSGGDMGGTSYGEGGHGGGPPYDGGDAPTCGAGVDSGGGGGSIGATAAADPMVTTTLRPGSGGGAGIRGGGGGGGGALRIASATSITISGAASVLAAGGAGTGVTGSEGSSGGGSGGALVLAAPAISIASGAHVSAAGGAGRGSSCPDGSGDGGLGRIRIAADPSMCSLGGTFNPPLVSSCDATPGAGTPGHVYVSSYPL